MVKSVYTAMSGAVARLRQLDIASNNLAQAETPGFRQRRESFQSVTPSGPTQALGFQARLIDRKLPADSLAVKSAGAKVSTRGGALVQTGRALDLAIEGPGFFMTAEKQPRLTRDGRLHIDVNGTLVTRAGVPIAVQGKSAGGAVQIPPGAVVTVQPDGHLIADGQDVGRVKLVEVKKPGKIIPQGAGLYKAAAGDTPRPAVASQLSSGFIEQSNVDPLQALVEIIAAERGFELGQKLLEASGELDNKAAREVGAPSL